MYNGDTKEFDLNEPHDESVNEIVEVRNGEVVESLEDDIINNMSYEEPIKKESPKKKNVLVLLKDKWDDLTKKEKLIAILIGIIILLVIVLLIVSIFKKDDKDEKTKVPDVVLEADNYRYENGKLFFLDKEDNEIGSYDCENKKQELCYVAYSSNEDNFDVTKDIYEDESVVLKRMSIINENYVFIYDNEEENADNIILYNIKDNSSSENYKLVKECSLEENFVVAKNSEDKYGVLLFNENDYEEKIEFSYDYLGIITENKSETKYLVGKKSDKWYLIDYSNKEKTKGTSNEIKNYNDSLIAVVENGEYNLIDYKNNLVTDEGYDYITFAGEFVLLVKDDKLYITDKGLNKLYEEGIKLPNSDYIKINVFNKESNKLVEMRYSFGVSINNKTIELTLNTGEEPEVKLINSLESAVSTHYENINYFDGKLYVYSDAEKNNLLGAYECTNKNNISSEDSSLDKCYIASNSEFSDNDMTYEKKAIGLLPIFNNRFVFIKDNPAVSSAETMNIVLYDLASSKKLGTYRAIDAGSYNGKNELNFVEGTGILLIAKNTKDYYGILEVKLSEVGSLANVKFNDKFKNIELINKNYILQKSTDTYYMINKSGESITSEFSGKIMGYNNDYVKVKNNNEYSVFTKEGNKISNKTFNYIELYNNVYAGINNNSINLYKYNDEEQIPLCSTDIKLEITNNFKEGKSFAVDEKNNSFSITVYKSDGTNISQICPEPNNEPATEEQV